MAKSSGGSLRRRRQKDDRGRLAVVALRVGVWTVALVAAALLIVGIVIGLRSLFFTANPHFVLHSLVIDVRTGPLDREEIRRELEKLGIREGSTNVYEFDQGELRERLEAMDLVRRVETRIVRPDTLELAVYGRQPTAYLLSTSGLLVDEEGVVMPPAARPTTLDLPVITGIPGAGDLDPGDANSDPLLRAAIDFVGLVERQSGGHALRIKAIQLVPGNRQFRVYLHGSQQLFLQENAVVVMPMKEMDEALGRVLAIIADRAANQQWTGWMDATYSKVPVEADPR